MARVLNEQESKQLIAAAIVWNKTVRQQGLSDTSPVYYREPGELLLIKNGELLTSIQITEGKNRDLFTEISPVSLNDADYQSEAGRPQKCLDFMMMNEDQDIQEYIRDGGIAVWYLNSAFCINLDQIVNMFDPNYEDANQSMNLDNVIFYRCLKEQPAPQEDKQYFLLRLKASFLVPLEDIRKMVRYNYQNGVKMFKIEPALDDEKKQITFKYTISHEVAIHYINKLRFRPGGSAVSADHCQANSSKLLYRIYPVQSDLNSARRPLSLRDSSEYQEQIAARLSPYGINGVLADMRVGRYGPDMINFMKTMTVDTVRTLLQRYGQWLRDSGTTFNAHMGQYDSMTDIIEDLVHKHGSEFGVADIAGIVDAELRTYLETSIARRDQHFAEVSQGAIDNAMEDMRSGTYGSDMRDFVNEGTVDTARILLERYGQWLRDSGTTFNDHKEQYAHVTDIVNDLVNRHDNEFGVAQTAGIVDDELRDYLQELIDNFDPNRVDPNLQYGMDEALADMRTGNYSEEFIHFAEETYFNDVVTLLVRYGQWLRNSGTTFNAHRAQHASITDIIADLIRWENDEFDVADLVGEIVDVELRTYIEEFVANREN